MEKNDDISESVADVLTRIVGLEEKYRILARNIDCFDTAGPAIFLILASGLIMKMVAIVVVCSSSVVVIEAAIERFRKNLTNPFPFPSSHVHNFLFVTVAYKCHNTIQIRKQISISTTFFQTRNTTQ